MKQATGLIAGWLILAGTVSAQEQVGTASGSPGTAEPAPAPAVQSEATANSSKKEKERGPYYKKVQGWLWLEAFVGPSSYNPDQFGSLTDELPNAPRLKGPEYGFAIGTAFGGPFFLGWFYRQASYDQYKLMKTGIDMQGNLRFIPYVHPMFRASIGYARTFDGDPYGLLNPASGGVSFTGGLGVRIPIVRWISFATTFDWTFVALSQRGDSGDSRIQSWIFGQQFGATFALTFHFIGVRKN
jgi:hypothetical protein